MLAFKKKRGKKETTRNFPGGCAWAGGAAKDSPPENPAAVSAQDGKPGPKKALAKGGVAALFAKLPQLHCGCNDCQTTLGL